MAVREIDTERLLALTAEGKTNTEISRQLGIPRSTVRDRLERLSSQSPPVETLTAPPPVVHNDALQEIVAWWQTRKESLAAAMDASRQLERTTYHVEHRWVEAIRRQADLDQSTLTQVVNEALRQYFAGNGRK